MNRFLVFSHFRTDFELWWFYNGHFLCITYRGHVSQPNIYNISSLKVVGRVCWQSKFGIVVTSSWQRCWLCLYILPIGVYRSFLRAALLCMCRWFRTVIVVYNGCHCIWYIVIWIHLGYKMKGCRYQLSSVHFTGLHTIKAYTHTGRPTSSSQCVHQICRHFSRQPGFFVWCFSLCFWVIEWWRKYLYECTPFWYVTCDFNCIYIQMYDLNL